MDFKNIDEADRIGKQDLVIDLMKMLKNGSKSDVTIVCEDGELKANKEILVARSEYFATMLGNGNYVEGRTDRIEMKNVQKDCMEVVLEYLFTGTMKIKDFCQSGDLLLETMDLLRLLLLNKPANVLGKVALKYLDDVNNTLKAYKVIDVNAVSGWTKPSAYQWLTYRLLEAEKLRLKKISTKLICVIANHIDLFNQAWDFDATPLNEMPFESLKQILEKSAGKPSWKIKAFNLWLSSNEDSLSDKEEVKVLKSFKDIISKSVD